MKRPRLLYALLLCIILSAVTSETVFSENMAGTVILDSIPANSSWQGNDTGANPDSIFDIQIDDGPREKVSIRDRAEVDKLDTGKRHLVKIYLDGKRIESFWFGFETYKSNRLRLSYNPFYGTGSLSQDSRKTETQPVPAADTTRSVKSIHVFVALCDNEKQGIVPVPRVLGNGNDSDNNLYWGALYGVRTYFKKHSDWALVRSEKAPGGVVLERCIFRHKTGTVYMIADAYRGAEIKQAIEDLFNAAAGKRKESAVVNGQKLNIYGGADMLVYIGHNGLMDFDITPPPKTDGGKRNVMVLACKSKPYFGPRLSEFGAKSVLLTTGFMSPEAYTLQAALDAWIAGENKEGIRKRAAAAYDKYQKCSLKAAMNLFYSE